MQMSPAIFNARSTTSRGSSAVFSTSAFEAASGRDLGTFFHVYLRQPALPELVVERTGEDVALAWRLPEGVLADGEAFEVPVEVAVGDTPRRVEMPGGRATLTIDQEAPLDVDPNHWLLRVE